ncbi:MAG: hypothetical protein NC543_11020 [bacterium]|nr:hypothetical protein [bacterium]MCM1374656.1 hypothetical protein [Muribaculum sp.]
MNVSEQYQEISRLKQEINVRLSHGTDYAAIKKLAQFLAENPNYQKLYKLENQLIKLQHFLTIWREEQERMTGQVKTDNIFYQINSLDELEQKYCRIEYYGLRIENHVPEPYCSQLLDWLLEHRVSGIALGIIIRNRTEKGMENILCVARELKRKMDLPNAVYLLQYAREKYPGVEAFLLEEADCWMQVGQWRSALSLLQKLETPTAEILEIMTELRQVIENDE